MSGIARLIVHGIACVMVLATLVLVGQPLFANDTWIHLALGEAFAALGPWLDHDPHLFAAPGPPSPSSWLGSWAIFKIYDLVGFTGLRIVHVAAVATLLGLVFAAAFKTTRSALWASAGVVFFILLSTYRIVQLRPHLFTIAAMLVVYLLVLVPRFGPDRRRIAAAALISLLWANTHAAFLLGPILVIGVSLSLLALGVVPWVESAASDRLRGLRVGIAGAWMLLVSLINPQGGNAHLAYFSSGDQTLALGAIVDEWGPTNLLVWPVPRLPPTWAAWSVTWVCALAAGAGLFVVLRKRRDSVPHSSELAVASRIDPALVALSVASVAAAVTASRFLWMGIFPLMLLGGLIRGRAAAEARLPGGQAWALALVVAVAAVGHFKVGDWPLVSRALGNSVEHYREPYRPTKYFGHSMWFLEDAGVEGRIFNDYPLGGFMSFWLTPELKMASSGTMNVEREAMEANLAITGRSSSRPEETFAEVLDRQGFDLFLGTGLSVVGSASRPGGSTVRHLETEPGWIPIFRSLRSAVYLRRNDRNAENLRRVSAYYASQGVFFNPAQGFQVERVIAGSPEWAYAKGLIPDDFENQLAEVRQSFQQGQLTPEVDRLALYYATLGAYDRAVELDRAALRLDPRRQSSAERLIWSLLQARRDQEALEAARSLDRGPLSGGASGAWQGSVESFIGGSESTDAARRVALPLMNVEQGRWLQQGFLSPEAREGRPL